MRGIMVLVALSLTLASTVEAQRRRTPPRIAVLVEGEADAFVRETLRLGREVDALLGQDYEGFRFPTEPTHVGDFTFERAQTLLAEILADREIDLVVVFGIQCGRAVAQTERLTKPVFLPFAEPRLQGLPREGPRSGRANLSYLTGLVNLDAELRRFREVVRRERAVVILDRHLYAAFPGLDAFVNQVAGESMQIRVVPVDPPASSILEAIPEDAEAVYIGPLMRLPQSEEQPLIDGINARRIPSYASEGRTWVDRGAFTSLVAADDVDRRMRRVALNIQETLAGEDPADFSIVFEGRPQLAINMATARRIGVSPSFALLTEAVLVGQDARENRGRAITLVQAVQEALDRNLGIEATRRDVAVAHAQVGEARGGWLPTLDANAGFAWLDPDAANTFGNAERQLSWGLSGQQVIYSPLIHHGVRAQEDNERSVEHAVRSRELDLIRDSAGAYLQVLRALNAERVNRENLGRIRRNLSLAEVRVDIGSAGREEVYRWQIAIADGRASVIAATAARNQAEIALNRLLNRDDLEEAFRPSDPTEPGDGLVLDERIAQYVDDPWSFRVLREFVAREAIDNSPEIRRLDAAIAAQEHVLDGRQRSLFVPDVVVTGGFNHVFLRAGEGSANSPIMGFPERDDFTWQLGAALRFRLFDAARYPQIEQTRTTIGQLQIQRRATAQAIEQGVRSAMHQAGASRAAVRLREDAATAADLNLELVTDAYSRGAVNIITLIDAQNQALVTRLAASNALYDFLLDYLSVERAAAAFGFRLPTEEREDFIRRLVRFAAERRRADRDGDVADMEGT